jgi:hypothetical protein
MFGLQHGGRAAIWFVVVSTLHMGGGVRVARSDVFDLSEGGRLQGEWLNKQDPAAAQYEMRTTQGVYVALDKSSVRQARDEVSVDEQYREILTRYGDDEAGQWALAEWCRKHGLERQRRQHLQRLLEHAPDHLAARLALGYSQVHGRWLTQEAAMGEQGYVLYRGRWRLAQQVELMEAQRRRELAERQWYRQLFHWRVDLSTQRHDQAVAGILAVRDPCAVPGATILLRHEDSRPLKLLWMNALANIQSPEALNVLVDVVLQDPDLEVAHSCLDRLVAIRSPLAQRRFLEALRHERNEYVNRAGVALGRLGEKSAIDSLIDALVTMHRVRLNGKRYDEPILVMVVPMQNRDVLAALKELTATNGYGYDERAWKQWVFLQNKHAAAQGSAPKAIRRDD